MSDEPRYSIAGAGAAGRSGSGVTSLKDIKETLKREILRPEHDAGLVSTKLGLGKIDAKSAGAGAPAAAAAGAIAVTALPPRFGETRNLFELDTFNTNTSDNSNGTFQWDINVQGDTKAGMVGARARLDSVVRVRVGSFRFPALADVPYVTNTGTDSGLPVLTGNPGAPAAGVFNQMLDGRFTMELQELRSQGAKEKSGASPHFEFEVSGGTARPVRDTLVLSDPATLDRFTLRLRGPDRALRMPAAVLSGVAAYSDAGSQLQLQFAGHGLAVGDVVYVEGFVSGNAVLDNWLARPEGHLVGAPVTDDAFYLNPNVTVPTSVVAASTAVPSSARIVVRVQKNRIRVPLELSCVVGRRTNLLLPTLA